MLGTWLGDLTLDAFRAQQFKRSAIAKPATARDACELLDWNVLLAVLGSEPAPDVLVVARGQLIPMPPPRTARDLGLLLRHGAGLCVRHAERHHANLRRVASALERALPGASAQVQLFVTPAQTYGFSWHYDDEDVFIAQTVGRKDYFFRENTVAADVGAHSSVFPRFTSETTPICNARLHAGDFLYLPARWWHMAECLEDSLSISVGISGATR